MFLKGEDKLAIIKIVRVLRSAYYHKKLGNQKSFLSDTDVNFFKDRVEDKRRLGAPPPQKESYGLYVRNY